jgi:peroxiredoxin
MRILTFLLFLVFTSHFSLKAQQNTVILPETRKVRVDEMLYNKQTGEKMTGEQLYLLLKEKPGLQMETKYNRFGEPEQFIYDPNNPFFNAKKDPNLRPKVEETFPEFTLRTLEGNTFASEDLRGSWLLLHFCPIIQAVNKDRWEKMRSDIKTAREKGFEIKGFGIFSTDKDPIPVVGEYQDMIHLVNKAYGFFEMFHIIEIPTTILIDPSGKIIKYYFIGENIEFLEIMNGTK